MSQLSAAAGSNISNEDGSIADSESDLSRTSQKPALFLTFNIHFIHSFQNCCVLVQI